MRRPRPRTDIAALVRPGPLPARRRAALVLEILLAYPRVRLLLGRRPLPVVVARLRGAAGAGRPPPDRLQAAHRLGHPVRRTLEPLPWDSRCLTRSLVLVTMLARRGIAGTLVIGVLPDAERRAHAWVEVDGCPILPTLGFAPLTAL